MRLPSISLGGWQNLGALDPFVEARRLLRIAFDRGVTHFDYANNYGRPPGSAEEYFGMVMDKDFRPYRDELFIATKAGFDMWPGPYGAGGVRKYLIASLEQSLRRMRLSYVDLFYSHCHDPHTPLEETATAMADIVRQGKALYVGISSYPLDQTTEMLGLLADLGTPCLAYQGSYSMLNRWAERAMIPMLAELGVGFVAFSPLNQGLLSDKYLRGSRTGARMDAPHSSFPFDSLPTQVLDCLRGIDSVAAHRDQTLAQLALRWVLRLQPVASAVMGVRTVGQLQENLAALEGPDLQPDELTELEQWARDFDFDPWRPADVN